MIFEKICLDAPSKGALACLDLHFKICAVGLISVDPSDGL